MDQGRQGRDQVDTAVVQDVRGQRRAAPTSCARLQSWQLSPHACNTGADQGLVADELEGEADQDRREGGEPRTLCRLPNGGGRHPTTNVPGILRLIAELRPQPPPAPVLMLPRTSGRAFAISLRSTMDESCCPTAWRSLKYGSSLGRKRRPRQNSFTA